MGADQPRDPFPEKGEEAMRLQLPKWYEEDLWHPLGFGPGIDQGKSGG